MKMKTHHLLFALQWTCQEAHPSHTGQVFYWVDLIYVIFGFNNIVQQNFFLIRFTLSQGEWQEGGVGLLGKEDRWKRLALQPWGVYYSSQGIAEIFTNNWQMFI